MGEKAREFQKTAVEELQVAKARLGPLAAPEKHQELKAAMAKFLAEMQARGRNLPFGLGVLDETGVVLAGAYSDPKGPGGQTMVDSGRNYSQYDKVKQAIRGPGNSHFTLYTTDGAVYMVCSPLEYEGRPAGAVCLALLGDSLHKDFGVSDQEFAALNFN